MQKKFYFIIDDAKSFVWITTNCGKFLKFLFRMPDHLTCLLRLQHAGQEATVRTGHGTTDWFQLGKGVCQGCILLPCLFNFCAEYIMRNVDWMKLNLESRLPGEIHNLRYADDTTFMAEREEELKSLLIKVKEESEKAGLKMNIQKAEIIVSGPITS